MATSNKNQINHIGSSLHMSVFWRKETGFQKVVLEKRGNICLRMLFVFIITLHAATLKSLVKKLNWGREKREEGEPTLQISLPRGHFNYLPYTVFVFTPLYICMHVW